MEGHHFKQQLSRPTPFGFSGDTIDANENVILILLLSNPFHHLLNWRENEEIFIKELI